MGGRSQRTLWPSADLSLLWPSFLSRRVSKRFGMLAFILASGDEGAAVFWSCRIEVGSVNLGGAGTRARRDAQGGLGNGRAE